MAEDYQENGPPMEGGESISLRRRFFNYRTVISLAIAIGILFLVFTLLDIDFSATWDRIRDCSPQYYVLAFICFYMSFPLRAVRWRVLLHSAGIREDQGVKLPSIWGMTQMMLINWFANSVLYARLGDAYRAYLLKQHSDVSFSRTLGTVLAERVLDIIIIVLLVLVATFWFMLSGGGGTGVIVVVLVAAIVLLLGIALLLGGMGRFGHRLAQRLPQRIRLFYTLFEEGTLSSFGHLPLLASLSVGIWLLESGRLVLVAYALGFDILEVGLPILIFAALGNALITAIPLTPGGIGLVEPGVAGLLMISLIKEDAWSIALVDRSISFLSVIAVGLILFAAWHLTVMWKKRREAAAGGTAPPGSTEDS